MLYYFLSSIISVVCICFAVWHYNKNKNNIKFIEEINRKRKSNVVYDLELATSDDLIRELFSRHNLKLILLRPFTDKRVSKGIVAVKIDTNNVSPNEAIRIFKTATMVITQNLSNKEQPSTNMGDFYDDTDEEKTN